MKKILLLSDTHSYMDERILDYAQSSDEIWHAGDFGNQEVIDALEKIKPLIGVFGNIDDAKIRMQFPEVINFEREGVKVVMTHIGGYPKKYAPGVKKLLQEERPKLFIAGHSHIVKAIYDEELKTLHLNPGACGKSGWHKVRTMMRFQLERGEIKNLEVIELGAR